MTPPLFRIAVREKCGRVSVFKLQHPDIQDYEQARVMVHAEVPTAQAVLITVPRNLQEQAA